MIIIERKPFNVTNYYGGTYTADDIEYIFTIVEMNTLNEVVWVDKTPKDNKKIELDILRNFEERKDV